MSQNGCLELVRLGFVSDLGFRVSNLPLEGVLKDAFDGREFEEGEDDAFVPVEFGLAVGNIQDFFLNHSVKELLDLFVR